MNSTIIRNWNERVKDEDVVIHNGDFCFRNSPKAIHRGEGDLYPALFYEKQLNGKIIYIKAHHDSNNSCKTCIRNMKIKLGGKLINIVHDPQYVSYNVDINLVGHIHNLWKIKRFYKGKKFVDAINIGQDVWNFMPITIEEILKEYHRWLKEFKSYHEKKEIKNEIRTP